MRKPRRGAVYCAVFTRDTIGDPIHGHAFTPHDELNVYQSAEARFELAAKKLGLEEALYRFLKYPNKEITVYIPVTAG